jgi:cytoskeletal protein CcmA (bactofilin family)
MARPQAHNDRSRGATSSSHGGAGASIGRGTRVRGRVEGDGALRVEGEIAGDVRVTGALDIDATGNVTGNVDAAEVTIEGALTGDVASRGRVAIRAGAQVEGNMVGSEIALEEGASFSGRIDADFELPDGLEQG